MNFKMDKIKKEIQNLNLLKKKIKDRYNTQGEWNKYVQLGEKHLKSKLRSKKFRSKFYAGEW